MQKRPSKRSRFITALLAVFFVVYCSVGVCTNLIDTGSDQPHDKHAHHQMGDHSMHDMQSGHCEGEGSCDWSLNSVSQTATLSDLENSFYFAYLIPVLALLIIALSTVLLQRRSYAFARERFYQHSYPRIHLQQAVFLN